MKKTVHKINRSHHKSKKVPKKANLRKLAKPNAKGAAKTKAKTQTRKMVLRHIISKFATKPSPAKHTLATSKAMFGPVNVKPYKLEKNEEYMSKQQLEHFREILLQWKGELMAEVDRTMRHMQNEVANYPDPVDRASQEEEFNLELRARDRERKLLRKIEETLGRIDDTDYGYCDDCGAEIGIRRLEARPTATQCIECKTIAEIREKQVGEGV